VDQTHYSDCHENQKVEAVNLKNSKSLKRSQKADELEVNSANPKQSKASLYLLNSF
jgi:hypothetical protein